MKLDYDDISSPLGTIRIVVADGAVCALDFGDTHERMLSALEMRYGDVELRRRRDPAGASRKLRAYFDGELEALDAIPAECGGTEFQQSVWSALRTIPVGATRSYADLARRIGRPRAVRAVGAANGSNPVPLIVPCHRVIGSDGTLTGYGGGLDRKRWLLHHEGAPCQRRYLIEAITSKPTR
jgi:methylated-DNA-[protein]-cysteine S-methyltransferase